MNSVTLTGRLYKDVDIHYTNGGMSIARFGIACNRRFKSEGQPEADFIGCIAFGKTAEFIEKYFQKGSGIEVNGRIQTGSYSKEDGTKVYTTDVVIENVEFPKGSSKADGEKHESNTSVGDGFMSIPDGIDEDELPFV